MTVPASARLYLDAVEADQAGRREALATDGQEQVR